MKKTLFLLTLAAALLPLAPTLFAQATGSSTIGGTVADESGGVIPGVQVTVTNVARGSERNATTNENGI